MDTAKAKTILICASFVCWFNFIATCFATDRFIEAIVGGILFPVGIFTGAGLFLGVFN